MIRARRIEGRRIRRRRRIGARVDAIAADIGVTLMPWQREATIRLMDGETAYIVGGRQAGRSATRAVLARATNHTNGGAS